MAILTINTGSGPNSNDGDSIRTAFHKTNINFQELSTLLGTTGTNLVEVVIDTNAQLFNHNSHTGVSIVYNDPANILIMSVDPGPQGPSGSVGPSGPSGPSGAASNVSGPSGPIGVTGPSGPSGAASNVSGPTGPSGPNGVSGPTGPSGPATNFSDQDLYTTSSVIFNSIESTKVTSVGGYPINNNGEVLVRSSGTYSPALLVSNYTSGIYPEINIRGWAGNNPGGRIAFGGNPTIYFDSARGTHLVPSATLQDDVLFAITGNGYDGTRFTGDDDRGVAQIFALAAEKFASTSTATTNAGSRFVWRIMPPGVIKDSTSGLIHYNEGWIAGSASNPPQISINHGHAGQTAPTLVMSNGIDSHVGFGAANFQFFNSKFNMFGVPFEDHAVFTADFTGTTMTVNSVSVGVLSVGQRIFGNGLNSGTFITSLGTGVGGTGTYVISSAHPSNASGITVNSGPDNETLRASNVWKFITQRKNSVLTRRNALRKDDSLGVIEFRGQNANNASNQGVASAKISVIALENFTSTTYGSSIVISTVNSGTTTLTDKVHISNKAITLVTDEFKLYDSSNNLVVSIKDGINFSNGTTQTTAYALLDTIPTSSTSTGIKGQIAVDSTSMYICVATDTWLRFNGVTF